MLNVDTVSCEHQAPSIKMLVIWLMPLISCVLNKLDLVFLVQNLYGKKFINNVVGMKIDFVMEFS